MAKLILTHEVSGLGAIGDVVTVKDGYARNYLVPRGLATAWSKGAESEVTAIRKARKAREIATLEDARAVRDALQGKPFTVSAKAGPGGRLFGAVTTGPAAAAVEAAGGTVVSGLQMLLHQAYAQVEQFTGRPAPRAQMAAALG